MNNVEGSLEHVMFAEMSADRIYRIYRGVTVEYYGYVSKKD